MVNWLIKKLHKFNAREISASADNRLPNGLKPDIELRIGNQTFLLDVGFSTRPQAYYSGKIRKYQHLTNAIVQPIIIGKDFTIHKDSLAFLEKCKAISMNELFTEIGRLIATHYAKCCAHTTQLL
jgi:hypothetical protein